MAATILSERLLRAAPADLRAESINLLVREKGIMELAKIGCSRDEAKRILFLGWLARRRDMNALEA